MKTVAFLARWPGVMVLDYLLKNPDIDLLAVLTHGRLSKVEGGGIRPELSFYRNLASEKTNLVIVDAPGNVSTPEVDLLLCLSWRFKIPNEVLSKARNRINIHRGELPKYAGAEPVKRAILAGESSVAITAHEMTDVIDGGERIAVVHSKIPHVPGDLEDRVRETKLSLYPLYVPLTRLAISTCR